MQKLSSSEACAPPAAPQDVRMDFSIPAASIDRMQQHLKALAAAVSPDAALAALFLLHCEMKDVEDKLPAREELEP